MSFLVVFCNFLKPNKRFILEVVSDVRDGYTGPIDTDVTICENKGKHIERKM